MDGLMKQQNETKHYLKMIKIILYIRSEYSNMENTNRPM